MQDILQQLSPILGNPALWLAVTLVAFIFGQHLYKLTQFNPLFTPIIVAVVSIIVVLLVMGVPYEQYFQGAGVIHFLLGPATVVLAVPLFEQRQKLVELWLPLTCGLLAGSVAAIVSVVAFGWLFGLSAETMISMIPKSVTTPIAMGVSEAMGGRPDLTACLVVITGIFGSIVGRPLFNLCRITSDTVRIPDLEQGGRLRRSGHGPLRHHHRLPCAAHRRPPHEASGHLSLPAPQMKARASFRGCALVRLFFREAVRGLLRPRR